MKMKIVAMLMVIGIVLSGCGNKKTTIDPEPVEKGSGSVEIPLSETEGGDIVKQTGPYGSISITVPEGWSYQLCSVGDERVVGAEYGIHLYPEDAKEGFVELGHFSNFGVCGTGLTTEERFLAGDSATLGYYDGSEIWAYITFSGKNEGLCVLANCVEGWQETHLDQAMKILDSMKYDPKEQEGAIGVFDHEAEIEELSLLVSVKEISTTRATLEFSQYNRGLASELFFGENFMIEKKSDAGWNEADIVIEGDYGYDDVAHVIKLDGITEYLYEWEWLYGALDAGEYRIAVEISEIKDTGEQASHIAYSHFVLR